MSATAAPPSAPSAAPVDAKLDSICRRQTARFLDHLRASNQATPKLESDVRRVFGFIFRDVKSAMREHSPEAYHDKPANQ